MLIMLRQGWEIQLHLREVSPGLAAAVNRRFRAESPLKNRRNRDPVTACGHKTGRVARFPATLFGSAMFTSVTAVLGSSTIWPKRGLSSPVTLAN